MLPQGYASSGNSGLPVDQVVSANAEPKNVTEGVTAPYGLHLRGSSASVHMGGNVFTTEDRGDGVSMFPLVIDDQPIIWVTTHDELLFLNAVPFDTNNNPVLRTIENEIQFSMELPDVEFTGKKPGGGRLIVRSGSGVFIHLEFEPRAGLAFLRESFSVTASGSNSNRRPCGATG